MPESVRVLPGGRLAAGGAARVWDPYRSKLAAMQVLEMPAGLRRNFDVLYLGAAAGSTAGHMCDMVRTVYAVEFSPKPMMKLIRLAEKQENIVPIFADARHPERYAGIVGMVDVIYQDVAQPGQATIAISNAGLLKPGGALIAALKARSIDAAGDPGQVLSAEVEKLKRMYNIIAARDLMPFHIDHLGVIAVKSRSQEAKK